MGCHSAAKRYEYPFYCPHTIAQREAMTGTTFKETVRQTNDRNFIRMVMRWLDKHGPFLEDVLEHGGSDYFECENDVVTGYSLGEAAFQKAQDQAAAVVSFRESHFCRSPLQVVWYRSDDDRTPFNLPNFWERSTLEAHLTATEAAPRSWAEMIEQAQRHYTELTFINSIGSPLDGEPFSATIAATVLRRLDILNQFKGCFDRNGSRTAKGQEFYQEYFSGGPLFSDESETNKHRFAKQLTFVAPDGEEIKCVRIA